METQTDPSVGLNAATGGTLTGWQHVEQSLADIFTTRFGERVMREHYGSFLPALLGRNINPREIAPVFAAIASAIEQWEPRFRVTELVPVAVTEGGRLQIYIVGEYRPRATAGDLRVEGGARRIGLMAGADGIRIEQRKGET